MEFIIISFMAFIVIFALFTLFLSDTVGEFIFTLIVESICLYILIPFAWSNLVDEVNKENTQVEISQSDKNSSSKKQVNYDLELKKIEIEKERLALEKEKLELEKEKVNQSR